MELTDNWRIGSVYPIWGNSDVRAGGFPQTLCHVSRFVSLVAKAINATASTGCLALAMMIGESPVVEVSTMLPRGVGVAPHLKGSSIAGSVHRKNEPSPAKRVAALPSSNM